MKANKRTLETYLYGAALLIALGLRFAALGTSLLSDQEARLALQALDLARGGHPVGLDQPGYTSLTAVLFFVFGSGALWARFWPALAGSLLVLAPASVRERLGRGTALLLAFGLALEPSMVAASRQADGRMLAVFGLTFALVCWERRKPVLAGMSAGLGLLGGPAAWTLVLGWVFGGLAVHWWGPARGGEEGGEERPSWRAWLPWLAGTLVFGSTVFFFVPSGLSAFGGSLASFFQNWFKGGGLALPQILLAWVTLSPVVFVLGLTGLVAAMSGQHPLWKAVAWFWVFTFLLVCANPAHQAADLALAGVPFLALAANTCTHLDFSNESKLTMRIYMLLSAALLVSIAMGLSQLLVAVRPEEISRGWGILLGAAFLLLASFGLVAWGWSWRVASHGFVLGMALPLLALTCSAAFASASLGVRPENEVWAQGASPVGTDLAMKVLGNASEWQTGQRNLLDLVVSGVDSPSLRWALRDYRSVQFTETIPADAKPGVIITLAQAGNNLGMKQAYTGQGVLWSRQVNWTYFEPDEWAKWWFRRELPTRTEISQQTAIILWVRTDLFPAATTSLAGTGE